MELSTWTLVEQNGEHMLTSTTNCGQQPVDESHLFQDNDNRNGNIPMITAAMVGHNRMIGAQAERADYMGTIDNESLDFSQLEDFINNESNSSYFGDTLTHGNIGVVPRIINNPLQQSHNNTQGYNSQTPPHLLIAKSCDSVYNGTLSNITLDSTAAFSHPHHSLPESPPDSGSEPPYSPQEVQNTSKVSGSIDMFLHGGNSNGENSLTCGQYRNQPDHQLVQLSNNKSNDNVLLQHSSILTPLLRQQQQQQQQQQQTILSSPIPPSSWQSESCLTNVRRADSLSFTETHTGISTPDLSTYGTQPISRKKRKYSQDSSNIHVKTEPVPEVCTDQAPNQALLTNAPASLLNTNEEDFACQEGNSSDSGMYLDSNFQCIRFQAFLQSSWHTLCDQNLKELPVPHYRVDADKGFNFSNADDAFVCQKKNHFQITCHVQSEGEPHFVKTAEGLRKICSFHLHFYGVKAESSSQTIKVEQSQSDRSKKAFHPVQIDLRSDQVSKVTVGRLHFSETTSNNMRKKGKPNPDQRHFYLVVGLHAHCSDATHYPVVSHCSERIIVRASNPGQFESDIELCWQRGNSPESVYHAGRVGINTDRPDEALVVHGNVKVTGHIIKPSDLRVKENIQMCDTRDQLRNIQQLNVVQFTYSPDFSKHFGLPYACDTGVIAQQVQKILPDAVTNAGRIILPNGAIFDNFLLVDKERIYMENVGAVKELCKVTNNLETRIDELERINKKLVRLRRVDSAKSLSSYSTVSGKCSSNGKNMEEKSKDNLFCYIGRKICTNQYIQAVIILLVFVIALCLGSMAILYFLEFRKTYNMNLSTILINEKLTRMQTEWNGETQLLNELDRNNFTEYKVTVNSYHKYNKSQGKELISNQRSDRQPDLDTISQKIPKHKMKATVAINTNQHSSQDSWDDKRLKGDDISLSEMKTVGRPPQCNSVSSFESPSCQVFCCSLGIIHTYGDENDDSVQSSPKSRSIQIKQDISDSNVNVGQITSAANTLEEAHAVSSMAYTSNSAVPTVSHEQQLLENKPSWTKSYNLKHSSDLLGNKRRRRDVPLLKGFFDNGITISVHGSTFNETVGIKYCDIDSSEISQCQHGTATNISYVIPISKYLADSKLRILFQFSTASKYRQVASCSKTSNMANIECPIKNHEIYWTKNDFENEHLLLENSQHDQRESNSFVVDISTSLVTFEQFRVASDSVSTTDLCRLPSNKLGMSYLEYNIYLIRDCEQ